uniref:Cytochrome P450 CYP3025B1 n=1 Tax=Tigriopus kingsejongensis TaxID=1133412 RepID=A0A2H4FY78_9MAXI|nr:cytochrome P450 CYP3025B1 [Tigriopus kingsejongensis]
MLLYLLLSIVCLLAWLYQSITKKYGTYQAQGIAEYQPSFPFGSPNQKKLMLGQVNFLNMADEVYESFPNEKLVVHFQMGKPQVVVRDLELAKLVLIKDFDHFTDRRTVQMSVETEAQKVMSLMLTIIKGEQWKAMRNMISPIFTSGKLKAMTPVINKIGDDFVKHLEPLARSGEEFQAKDVMTNYTTDVIANCAFGIEANALKDPNSLFKRMILGLTGGVKGMCRVLTILFLPPVARLLKLSLLNEESTDYFVKVLKKTMKDRRESKVKRNDLMDMIIEALQDSKTNEGPTEDDQFERDAQVKPNNFQSIPQEDIEMYAIANAFVMFFAGFETSSTIMAICSVMLANHPDVQERLLTEIQDIIEEHGSQHLPYDVVQTLPYLDMVINETLRHYPLAVAERECVKDYTFPGEKLTVTQGMLVQVPSPAIMMDSQYFPNPKTFNPENFSEASKATRSPYAFLAFGQGPRNCVGMRFALLQVKIAMIRTVANYQIHRCSKTIDSFRVSPSSASSQPIGGTYITVSKRS